MKKLLSLLSVLTISGSAVPTTIAARPYQKQEIKLENNYSQENNLKTLNRNKRNTNSIVSYWTTDINNFKNNINFEKNLLIRRLPRTKTEEQKINKILEFQNNKIQELENKINQINKEISTNGNEEDKNKQIYLKACQAIGGYVSIVAPVAAVSVPVLGTTFAALISAIGGAAALICSLV